MLVACLSRCEAIPLHSPNASPAGSTMTVTCRPSAARTVREIARGDGKMKISSRSAARVLGLALGVAPWLGGTTTQAQFAYVGTPNPAYSVPYRYSSPTYA